MRKWIETRNRMNSDVEIEVFYGHGPPCSNWTSEDASVRTINSVNSFSDCR